MIELARSVDNPIVLRAVFGRIRFPGAWLGVGIIGAVCLFIVAGAFVMSSISNGRMSLPQGMTAAFGILFGLQCVLLFLVGTSGVSSAVAADRERAVFDMMRMVPRPASHIVGGYILGMPVREHLWVLIAMPFAWLAILFSRIPMEQAAALYLVFYALAFLYHSLGALLGIVMKKSRNASSAAVGILILYHLFGWRFLPGFSIYGCSAWVFNPRGDGAGTVSFFATPIPVWLNDVVFASLMTVFLWLAALRKFRTEDRPALSKVQSLLFAAVFQGLLLGGFYSDITGHGGGGWLGGLGMGQDAALIAYSCGAFAVSGMLVYISTPVATLYRRSVRRAVKSGRESIRPFQDAALNPVFTIGAVLLFGLSMLPLLPHVTGGVERLFALVVAFGSGLLLLAGVLQWCTLRFERSWAAVFVGLLVLLWGLPSGLAMLAGLSGLPAPVIAGLGGLFPPLGLGYALSSTGGGGILVSSVMGIFLAGVFTFLAFRARDPYWRAAKSA